MLVKNQKIEMKWNSINKKHYENRGYVFTKMRDVFYVNPNDLGNCSHKKVILICDCCKRNFKKLFCNFLVQRKRNKEGKDFCCNCRGVSISIAQRNCIEKVNKIIKKHCGEKYIWNEKDYKNTSSKLKFKCSFGHSFRCSLDNIRNKIRKEICPICSRKTLRVGKTHWNWKGGITELVMKIRNSDDYKIWRKKVYKRDNYTCQKCRVKGGYIEAHHIKSFSKHKKDIFNVDNGITLCKKCHREMHKGNRKDIINV
jgi:hypothetical protein